MIFSLIINVFIIIHEVPFPMLFSLITIMMRLRLRICLHETEIRFLLAINASQSIPLVYLTIVPQPASAHVNDMFVGLTYW